MLAHALRENTEDHRAHCGRQFLEVGAGELFCWRSQRQVVRGEELLLVESVPSA